MNPGSREAIDARCICAVLDNNHGKYPPCPDGGWWITHGCPVHAVAWDAAGSEPGSPPTGLVIPPTR